MYFRNNFLFANFLWTLLAYSLAKMLMKNDPAEFSVNSKAGWVETQKGGKPSKWNTTLDAVDNNLPCFQNQVIV